MTGSIMTQVKYIQYTGIESVRDMLKEFPGLQIMLDSAKGECFIMSDGFKSTQILVQDGDYVVMIPKTPFKTEQNAFFVFNPALLFGLLLPDITDTGSKPESIQDITDTENKPKTKKTKKK